MADFQRPKQGFRFEFHGMKLGVPADSIPHGKYPIAVNVRAYTDATIQTRPGLAKLFQTGGPNNQITDFRAYSAMQTDNLPRILTRNVDDTIWLDNGVQVGSLAGGGSTLGAVMIPFRPNQSPNPYMYVTNGKDYQKFSAPSPASAVTQQKVGIAEPQTPPDARINNVVPPNLSGPAYANAGTAGATTNTTRITDTVASVFQDPAPGTGVPIWSLQVSNLVAYQKSMVLTVNGIQVLVQDVFPGLTLPLTLSSIFYFVGNTGRCILVINSLTGEGGNDSIYNPLLLASLRRGAIIKIGIELALVISVAQGPDGSFAVETSTTGTHTTADTVTLIPTIQVEDSSTPAIGNAISDAQPPKSYQVTVGVGTQTTPSGVVNPFVNTGVIFQEEDYISMGFRVDVPANVTEFKILFDVDDGSFTKNFYYYTIRVSDLASAIANSITQLAAKQTLAQRALADEESAIASGNQGVTYSGAQGPTGANQWGQILIPISELTRVGTNQTKSLLTFTAFQVLWNVIGTVNVAQDGFFAVFGGFQPDVGDIGAPYLYRVRPRSKVTGVIGNPSPATRYGVNPRRESVVVSLPSAAYDAQIDTWDIFRYGGTVTSWRFVGSTPSTNAQFIDNFGDEAVGEGEELEFDNFEPWPSVDIPFNNTATQVTGTIALVTLATPGNLLRFLPGNLVKLGAQNVYTIRKRPVLLSGTTYLFEFVENAGSGTNVPLSIYEPEIANQFLPYMWGPDANGVVFACGDPLRLGTLYFSKPYQPDSAPSSFNQEITSPTEPLLGGEIVDGVSYVSSTERWWRLYFQPENPEQRYNPVQEPLTRGLAAPFGHCTDGRDIFWYAKDGIYSTSKGSLTDEDLLKLFPHEGILGANQGYTAFNGSIIFAPDYSRASTFRLTHSNGYLYAIYQDSTGIYRMLTLDLRRMAWCVDDYSNAGQVTAAYHVEQQAASGGTLNPVTLFAKRLSTAVLTSGIYRQTPLHNDDSAVLGATSVPISCILATNEWDGGDFRAPMQWGDFLLDSIPAAAGLGLSAFPISLGGNPGGSVQVGPTTTIPTGVIRSRAPVGVGGILVTDFAGLFLTWLDDYTIQSVPTELIAWQPSFVLQPSRIIGLSTFGSSYGLQGYGHIRQIAVAWTSTAPITLTIITFDGLDPAPIVIPSSGGKYQKQMFPIPSNKGQLFSYQLSSPAIFQVFEDDCEIHVGAWNRSDGYRVFKGLGGIAVAESPI